MRVSFAARTNQSLAVVLLLVACGGVSKRDGGSRNGESSGSGAQNGSGTGANGSGATTGSVGSGAIPGTGGHGNTAGIGGTSSLGGTGGIGGASASTFACHDACSNSLYSACISDAACAGCMQSYSSECAANEKFVAFNAYVCTCVWSLSCHSCVRDPSGAGGEAGIIDYVGGHSGGE